MARQYLICTVAEANTIIDRLHQLHARQTGVSFPYITGEKPEERIGATPANCRVEVRRMISCWRLTTGEIAVPLPPRLVQWVTQSGALDWLPAAQRTRLQTLYANRRAITPAEVARKTVNGEDVADMYAYP